VTRIFRIVLHPYAVRVKGQHSAGSLSDHSGTFAGMTPPPYDGAGPFSSDCSIKDAAPDRLRRMSPHCAPEVEKDQLGLLFEAKKRRALLFEGLSTAVP
jgi:hypothetical protein